jgi:FKBP-type peptidyl-prolyl cis-trans isomerase FkpA
MKKIVFGFICLVITVYFFSCVKSTPGYSSCGDIPVWEDSSVMLQFAKQYNITPTKDTSGMYYQIIDSGSGPTPNLTSKLVVSYLGTLMSGIVFDSATNSNLNNYALGQLIVGWQYGLPKIKKSGRIKLLLPSHLAYGCNGTGAIPSNSPVYFDIQLVDVQ